MRKLRNILQLIKSRVGSFLGDRFLLSLTLVYGLGILTATHWLLNPFWILISLSLLFVLIVIFYIFSIQKIKLLLLIFGGLAGILLTSLELGQSSETCQNYYNHYLTVEGFIAAEPDITLNNTRYILRADRIILGDQITSSNGKLMLVLAPELAILPYGQTIRLKGFLNFPSKPGNWGEFDYGQYLSRQGIWGVIHLDSLDEVKILEDKQGNFLINLALHCKSKLTSVIDQTLPPDLAVLFKGMALGLDGELASEWREIFSQVGVCHILSVSGLHVGFILILALGFANLLQLEGKSRILIVMLILLFYALMTGLNPPVVRATIMSYLFLWGKYGGRLVDWPTSLALAALIILLFAPLELFSPGFQMSFVATWGMLYLTQPLKHLFSRFKQHSVWIAAPLAAQLASLPLIAIYYNIFTFGSLLSNMLVVPLAGIIVPLGFIAAMIGLVYLPLASFIQVSTGALLSIMQALVLSFNSWPGFFAFVATPGTIWLILWYLFLGILGKILPHRPISLAHPTFISRPKKAFMLVTPLIFTFLLFLPALLSPQHLVIHVLDVGQGDSILLELPQGEKLLVDCGGSTGDFEAGSSYQGGRVVNYLKSLGINQIDHLLLTHSHEDHAGGVQEVLANLGVGELLICPHDLDDPETPFNYYRLLDQVKKEGIEIREINSGSSLNFDSQVKIRVLNPVLILDYANFNEVSIVLELTYGQQTILLTGDIEAEGQKRLLQEINSEITVYKVAHHGSANTDLAFLERISPQVALISCGFQNRYGHPNQIVLDKLAEMGTEIYRTDLNGAIKVTLDGQKAVLVEQSQN